MDHRHVSLGVRLAAALLIAAVSLASLGCQRQAEQAGDLVGVYAIVGSLVENSCGAGLPAMDPLHFEVQVRREDQVGYWQIAKRAAKSGTLGEDGDFRFVHEQTSLVSRSREPRNDLEPGDFIGGVEPDFDLQTKTCLMTIREVVEGTLSRSIADLRRDGGRDGEADGGGARGSKHDLEAENTIDVTPTQDSDCSASLSALGGPFNALPCSAKYILTGTLQASVTD